MSIRTLSLALVLVLATLALVPVVCEAQTADRFSSGLVWNGFHYEWDHHPHRLSKLRTSYTVDSTDFWTGHLIGQHGFSVKIGNFPSDEAEYFSHFNAARSTRVRFAAVRVGPIDLESLLAYSDEKTVTVTRHLESDLGIHDRFGSETTVRVLLAGFEIESANYDSGWHFQGLGVGVHSGTYDAATGDVRFKAWAFADPTDSPDTINGFDGSEWQDSYECRYQVYIQAVVVIGSNDDLKVTTRQTVHQTSNRTTEFEDQTIETVELQERPDPDWDAFLGTTSFRIELSDEQTLEGRYIRAMGIYAHDFEYEQKNGLARYKVVHHFSNRSATPYKWQMTSRSEHAVMEIRDAHFETKAGRISGRVATDGTDVNEVLFGN